jgi:hypothetical protein
MNFDAAYILRTGARQMRERCAPMQIWRRLDELAERVEHGEPVLPEAPHFNKTPIVEVGETPDD